MIWKIVNKENCTCADCLFKRLCSSNDKKHLSEDLLSIMQKCYNTNEDTIVKINHDYVDSIKPLYNKNKTNLNVVRKVLPKHLVNFLKERKAFSEFMNNVNMKGIYTNISIINSIDFNSGKGVFYWIKLHRDYEQLDI